MHVQTYLLALHHFWPLFNSPLFPTLIFVVICHAILHQKECANGNTRVMGNCPFQNINHSNVVLTDQTQARIAQLVAYQLGTSEVLGSNPGKDKNFSMKISNWLRKGVSFSFSKFSFAYQSLGKQDWVKTDFQTKVRFLSSSLGLLVILFNPKNTRSITFILKC